MPKRLVLFSQPSAVILEKLRTALFPEFLGQRVFAYMPSDGSDQESNTKYVPFWQQFAESNQALFLLIDNSKRGFGAEEERQKLLTASILVITGGNTYKLLHHLKMSGLDKTILELWQKGNVVLSGFSAGAIVLSPSIETAKTGVGDANELGLTDLSALGVVDFEIWPHYEPTQDAEVKEFQKSRPVNLKLIGNDDIVIIDK